MYEQGITVIVVTHEPDIAEHAERIVVFKDVYGGKNWNTSMSMSR
jgi:ABC-type lipoprotein export system ATPase subunit